MPAEIIDRKYEVMSRLGEGGMGTVFEAKNLRTGRRVAVKVVNSSELAGPESVGRFEREARACGRVESLHIAQVLDAGTCVDSRRPYMVMELLVGEDLAVALQRNAPLPPDVALRIIAQACLGLRAAHEAGIVHRDMKPANLFLCRGADGDLVVKLLDFGIAKMAMERMLTDEAVRLTRTGAVLGSPLYMSPEQAMGERNLDLRTDIWSIGVVLYEALTGVAPHGHADTLGKLILSICSQPARAVQEIAPWVSPDIAEIVHKALRTDPAERFASMNEMLEAMRAHLPNGFALRADELRPIDDVRRAITAERFRASASGKRSHDEFAETAAPTGAGASEPPNPFGETKSAMSAKDIPPSVATGRPDRPLRLGKLVAFGVAITAAAAIGVRLMSGGPSAAPLGSSRVASSPEPAPAATAAHTEPSTSSTTRTVRLAILPPDAAVEVDGRTTTPTDGAVDITGAVGSTHMVRLRSGGREITTEVTIAERGVMPPRVEMQELASSTKPVQVSNGPRKTAPRGVEPGTANPVAPAAPTIDRRFQ